MSNYNRFNPYQVASSSDVNENFTLVKDGLTNTGARIDDVAYATRFTGNIDMQQNSITNLSSSIEPLSPVINSKLMNYYKYLEDQVSTFDFGEYKTIIVSTTQIRITFNINTFEFNRYVYTIIALEGVTIAGIQISINGGAGISLETITPNCSLSFMVERTLSSAVPTVYRVNSSFNYNLIPKTTTNKQRKLYDSGVITITNQNTPITITPPSSLTNYTILNIELFINGLTLPQTLTDTSIYYLTYFTNNVTTNQSSYSNSYISTASTGTLGSALTVYNLNSSKNPIGAIIALSRASPNPPILFNNNIYTNFNFSNNDLSYNGYSINDNWSNTASFYNYNSHGGNIGFPTNNSISFGVISKPNNINIIDYNSFMFNVPVTTYVNLVSGTYRYVINYLQNPNP